MTPKAQAVTEPRVTLEDLKHKVGRIRDLAETEVRRQAREEWSRKAALVVGVALFALGTAYFLGSMRRCPPRRR